MSKIAVDTNVFIYVLQAHQEYGETAKLILSSYDQDSILASESIFAEILSSSVFVNNETAYKRAKAFLENAGITYIATTRQVYIEAAKIRRLRPAIKLPDAIHLASAWQNGAKVFITNDLKLVKLSTDARPIVTLARFADKYL